MATEQRTHRCERHQTETRDKRLYVTFSATELAVVKAAAGREQMAPAAWAARQLMAVAQHTLIPLSADTGDVLRELIRSRIHLQETVTALHTLTTPTAPFPVAFDAPANRPCAPTPSAPANCSCAPTPSAPANCSCAPTPSAPANCSCAPTPSASALPLPDAVRTVLDEALNAIRRVDEATVQVMRERRPRS
ncbi:hypothetical protein [Streptomyces sp. NPDC091649]|uniref:hypothetical protein n=1 Tax=Streptomyces sp. NPDC091649 TaxID=3366004 RepID=UPI003811818E